MAWDALTLFYGGKEMLLLIDSANMQNITRIQDLYPIDGVTTNPTIIAKEKKPFYPLLKEIRSIIGEEKMLHVQVVSNTAFEMVEEATCLMDRIGGNLYVKIPVIPEGIKAIKMLKETGIKTLATAIYTPLQAVVAAKAGAEFVAPYVNRIDNISANGVQVVSEIVEMFKKHHLDCKVLAASFKNVLQVQGACLAGAEGITADAEIIDALQSHILTDRSVEQFIKDWTSFYGAESNSVIRM